MASWQDAPVIDSQASGASAWQKAPIVGQGAPGGSATPDDSWLTAGALAGRAVGEGVLDTFAAPHDLSTAITNWARPKINSMFGTHLPQVTPFSTGLSNALTAAGAPVPNTPGEQNAAAIIKGGAGALTGLGLAGPLTTGVNALRAGLAGMTGGASSDLARQAGAGPVGQFAAGLAGGFTPAAIEGGALRAVPAIVRPFTRSGQAQLAANALTRAAENPQAAAANLANASPLVPGSLRTAGEASGDTGLLALEKGVRAMNPRAFGSRIASQNAARQTELGALGGTPADIAAAEQLRDAQTAPMRDAAFAQARQLREMNAPQPTTDVAPALGKRNYSTPDPTQDSITQWLAKHPRGLSSGEAAAQGIDPSDFLLGNLGIRRAFRKGGMSFDQAAEALHQAGYPVADESGNYSPNVLLDAVDNELRGHPVYSLANTRRFAELENGMGNPYGEAPPPSKPATITTPVHETIDQILSSPAGARESIGKTLRWAKGLIGEHTDPETLYEVRKDLALAQHDRLQPTGRDAPNVSMLGQARGQLGQVIKSLDDAIESGAPGYKAYLAKYSDLSQPIDQMEAVQGLQQKASSGLDTATGQPFLSAPQFARGLQGMLARTEGSMPLRLAPTLTQRLQAVREDLQRGNALSSPTVRTPGSDTFQNFMTGRRLGGGLVGHIPVVGKYLRGVNDFVDQR
ncbi:MAG: hypothetical protein ACREFP_06510, partial [Acetobacteraceae bacterium]